jgi:methylated-DNA-[protein]-cysteine S-methyltransferase
MWTWGSCTPAKGWSAFVAASDQGIVKLSIASTQARFLAELAREFPKQTWKRDDSAPLVADTSRQLAEYLDGKRREFELPLDPHGTPFQKRVWNALRRIPYGKTKSYGEVARTAGSPRGARAVGMANHDNPIAIVVPCHRVIAADGSLGGYACGLDFKRKLLNIEAAGAPPPAKATRPRRPRQPQS